MPTQELGDGKYKIIRRLAVGGMAEIYLAEAANIHGFRKKVVIKRILPQYANQSGYVEMFLDEARLAARLNHASIVQVFDIGQDPEGVFFTMEYVEGRDLSEILGACYRINRLLKLEEVLAILIPSAEALHHAHELRDDTNQLCNLIHRDVSPSNILVTQEGRVKLLDFGVAKSNAQQRETTGVSLKGKFGYMSPEQVQGHALDRRADIFSFGVVLWELCTGRRLYPGGNDPSVLLKIINEQPGPPSAQRSDLAPQLDSICLRALSRDPNQRYGSMQELIHDLDDFAKENGIVTNSRTLSRLLDDVFSEYRATEAIPAQSYALPLPSQQVVPVSVPVQQQQPYQGSEPYAAPGSQSFGLGGGQQPYSNPSPSASMPYQMASYGDASSVHPAANRARWPIVLAGIALLTAGVAAVLAFGSKSDGSPTHNVVTPVDAPIVTEPSTVPTVAPLPETADATPSPVEPGVIAPGVVEPEADASVKEPAAAPPRTDTRKNKARPKGSRNTSTNKRPKGNDKPKGGNDDAWDPNSPFAPE
tara:strand:+ start:3182 stop:4780 length:1599 start_codon:yes stop_codon:yes gene_type:complete